MKISLKILLATIVFLGIFITLKLYLNRDKDALTYYDNLKTTRINIFKGWHIYPREKNTDFMTFMCMLDQFENYSKLDSIEKKSNLYFHYDKVEGKIKFPHNCDSSEIKSCLLLAKLLNIDSIKVKDTINHLLKEYLKCNAFRILGAVTPENFISFDFGKNGNINLLYIPEEADNEQRIRMTKGDTRINRNWTYHFRNN